MGLAGGLPQINTAPYGHPMQPMTQPQQSPLQGRMSDMGQNPYVSSPATTRMMSPASYHTAPNSAYGSGPMLSRANSGDNYPRHIVSRGNEPPIARSATSSGFETGSPYGAQIDTRFPRPSTADPRTTRPNSFPPGNTSGWNTSPTSPYAPLPSQGTINGFAGGHVIHGHGASSFSSHPTMPTQMSLPPPLNPAPTLANGQAPSAQGNHYPTTQYAYPSGPMDMNGPMADSDSISNQDYPQNSGFRSPYIMSEEFTDWLLSDGDGRNGVLPMDADSFMNAVNPMPRGIMGLEDEPMNNPLLDNMPTPDPMAVNAILDRNETLSEVKWRELLNITSERFNETKHKLVKKQKDALFQGDYNEDGHPLSLRMFKTYIGSYWYHFHPQMPILHQPTFSADQTNSLLLMAMISIGATCLDKVYGERVARNGSDLSNFLSWHLRGEIFQDEDFKSPAELWIFQALLLLEVYEKMYSTRTLHERAHIHHATTSTLMRRGSALIGRSALDSPPLMKGEDAKNGQNNHIRDPEQWWHHWITNEGTRRAAFAAFIIDSLHATMFGHTATMVAHEMKVQLPCDESLWSATSSVEVGRLEAELAANGVKPITFCDGLKSILRLENVRTNAFGRTALMAGVLNVSWHMNQRDTQVRSLGDFKTIAGGKKGWRGTLTHAYDFWKADFDTNTNDSSNSSTIISRAPSHTHYSSGNSTNYPPSSSNRYNRFCDEDNIFESKTVLHHLAHMAMHMDIVSCQIFAKAERLLGRTTLPSDRSNAHKRIVELWAPKASARDATYYSLKFLKEVLIPKNYNSQGRLIPVLEESQAYAAKDDYLLNRPWVLYYASLIVWSYGYARERAVPDPPPLTTYREKALDMYAYLERVGGVDGPDKLEHMTGLNRCLGLLYILRDMFDKCAWELLHEAARLLGNCITMLKGEDGDEGQKQGQGR